MREQDELLIERFENLPFRLSKIKYHIVEGLGSQVLYGRGRRWKKDKNPYQIAEYIFSKYLGEKFDDAFSKYCKKVDKRYQKIFIESITPDIRWLAWNDYIVDEEGLIQLNPTRLKYFEDKRKNQKIIFKSAEYKLMLRNIKTEELFKYSSVLESISWNFEKFYVYKFTKEFDSKKDREYIRLKKEKIKKINQLDRLEKKEKKQKAYSFLTREEEKLRQEKERDLLARDSHGFNEESFRYDPYHGQQRKKKQIS